MTAEAVPGRIRSPRKLKTYTILAGFALAGLVFLAYSQSWVHTHVSSPQGGTTNVTVAGSSAASSLAALALAGLALIGATTIAGHVIRVILGVFEVLLGVGVVVTALSTILSPLDAAKKAITTATGVDGADSVRALVLSHSVTPWPYVALVVGLAMAALGLLVIVTSRRWPAATRRYQSTLVIDPDAPADPVVAWDTLTHGDDPTVAGQGDDPAVAEPGDAAPRRP